GTPAERKGALRALQQMHDVQTVNALVALANRTTDAAARTEIQVALARLANVETPWKGPWDGGWWGTKPDFTGPYFAPMAWEGTATIRPVLQAALTGASGQQFDALAAEFSRNRVVPLGAAPLLTAANRQGGAVRTEVIAAL